MIKHHSLEQHTNALANYVDNGVFWVAKNIATTVLRRFLEALAPTLRSTESLLLAYQDQFLPDSTVFFINEWEDVVGIPDDCFDGLGDINERRSAVLVKLAGLPVQTEADFVRVAALFGITVNVVPGVDSGLILPILELRFTIVIEYVFEAPFVFPLVFPIVFGSPSIPILSCLYNKIRPANCQVFFVEL